MLLVSGTQTAVAILLRLSLSRAKQEA